MADEKKPDKSERLISKSRDLTEELKAAVAQLEMYANALQVEALRLKQRRQK